MKHNKVKNSSNIFRDYVVRPSSNGSLNRNSWCEHKQQLKYTIDVYDAMTHNTAKNPTYS